MNEKKHSLVFNGFNKNFEITYGSESLKDLNAEFYQNQMIISVFTGQKLEVFHKNKLIISEIINHSKIFNLPSENHFSFQKATKILVLSLLLLTTFIFIYTSKSKESNSPLGPENPEPNPQKPIVSELSIKYFTDSTLNCRTKNNSNECSKHFVKYFNINSDQPICQKINQKINSKVYKVYSSPTAKSHFNDYSRDFFYDYRTIITIYLNKSNIISFLEIGVTIAQGAARPMYYMTGGFNYDIQKNKEINLYDIILTSKKNSFFNKLYQVVKQQSTYFNMNNININQFSITEEGLCFYHDLGIPAEILVPFSLLQDELTDDWIKISNSLK